MHWGTWLLAALMGGQATMAAAADYRFVDDPPEMRASATAVSESSAAATDGLRYLVVDDRVDLTGARPESHHQVMYEVVAERGLEPAGRFSINYQPAFQTVSIHAIDVWRGGRRLDRRHSSRIDVLRREEDLERGLLDGSRTLSITMPDVRLGDRIDYRYTLHGYNPVFGDGYYERWRLRYSEPLAARAVSIRYPADLRLRTPSAQEGFEIEQGIDGTERWWRISGRGLSAIPDEQGTPASHASSQLIEASTAGTWGEVVAWALPMYSGSLTDRARARQMARELDLDPADPEGSLLRAVAFVQGEIRYTGLDMGVQSHAPNRPELVLERRFGDCKDKSQLLIALLKEAGVDAQPVLVNSRLRSSVAERTASPLAFDHVVVRANLSDGPVWIDATRQRERGPLRSRGALPFGSGLVIAADSNQLVDLPDPFPVRPLVDVNQRLDFSEHEGGFGADFKVATNYLPGQAESIRDDFSAKGAEDVGKRYLAYMQTYYQDLRADGAPVLDDAGHHLDVVERYRLEFNRRTGGTEFGIVLFQLLDWVPSLPQQTRSSPWEFGGPRFGRQTISSHHPGGWNIATSNDEISNDYFSFRRAVKVDADGLLIITAEWKRLADEVPATGYEQVRADLEKVRDLLQYDVDLAAPLSSGLLDARHWIWPLLALLGAMVALLVLWLPRRRWIVPGMMYRPRTTVVTRLDGKGLRAGLVLGVLGAIVEVLLNKGGAMSSGAPAHAVIALAVAMTGSILRWALFSWILLVLLKWLGHRVSYMSMLQAYGAAQAPLMIFLLLAILALRFRLNWLDDDPTSEPGQLPALLVAIPLLFVGIAWWMVSLAGACAGVARARWTMGTLVVALSILPLTVIAALAQIWLAMR